MQTIEFETYLNNGLVQVPSIYRDWYNQTVKVILVKQETVNKSQQEDTWHEVQLLNSRLKQTDRQFNDSALLIREERDK